MSGRDVDPAQGAGQASTSQGRSFDAGPSAWIAAFEAAGYRSGPEGPHPSALLDPRGDRRGAEAAYRLWLAAEPDNERALRRLKKLLLDFIGRNLV